MASGRTDGKKSTGSKKTTGSKAKSGGRKAPAPEPEKSFLRSEVSVIVAFAAAVLLFLSNFHLCGALGEVLRSVQLGVFGMIGFAAPLLLFVGTCFAMANIGSSMAKVKMAAVIIGIWVLCGLAEMVFGAGYTEGQTIGEIYTRCSSSGLGGGALGGLLVVGIGSVLGTVGVYLVLLVAFVICVVCITEKSVVNVVKRGGGRAYQYAKEDAGRRRVIREEKREERRRLREDQKVRGVNLRSTKIEALPDDPEPEDEDYLEPEDEDYLGPDDSESEDGDYAGADDPEFADGDYAGADALEMDEAHDPGAGDMEFAGASASLREFDPSVGNQGFMDELLPDAYRTHGRKKPGRADIFTGNITRPPVYIDTEDDTVPFDDGDVSSLPDEYGQLRQTGAGGREPHDRAEAWDGGEPRGREVTRGGRAVHDRAEAWDDAELRGREAFHGGGAAYDSGKTSDGGAEPERRGTQNGGEPCGREAVPVGGMAYDRGKTWDGGEPRGREEAWDDAEPHGRGKAWDDGASAAEEEELTEFDYNPQDTDDWTEVTVDSEEDLRISKEQSGGLGFAADGMSVAGGEIAMEEGTKKVVTASGKIIESDTEVLRKKLESRRQEALEEKNGGVDAEIAARNGSYGSAPSAVGESGGFRGGRVGSSGSAPYAAGENARPGVDRTGARTGQQAVKPPVPVKKEYQFPPISLLNRAAGIVSSQSDQEYRETAIKLQQTLRDFGVGVTVTNVSCGPSVTRYELHPEQGVKVSRIVGLSDDIKLSLAAADIRIEAPIPGKSAVGIEVPNKENHIVYLRELLESDSFKNHPSRLAFAVGKDIGGQVVVTDIAKMPHLLIAGSTGSGKSVCINTLIMSIIYKAHPDDVKLIMVDPKVVELSVYNGIPHLLIPVVTDPKKASGALNWAVAEMDDRYKKFAAYNVRDLKGYNAKVDAIGDIEDENKPVKMPQIVIIIDELADLMMVAPGEVEDSICRLAQLARAAGIHLVIATQRPSVNVITGLIKANVPSRIAFAVASGVDSRTILDMVGAEKLLGKGDMLFYPSGMPKPQRVQGAFVSDSEVSKVVEFLTEQFADAGYSTEIENQISLPQSGSGADSHSDRDEYFAQAGRFIIEKDKASIGMLQRMYKIGFNRAARIMDQLAEAGVVGEDEGTKPRKVLMTPEEFEEFLKG